MGLPKRALPYFFEEIRRRPFRGRILTLGRQDVYFGAQDLEEIAAKHNVPLIQGLQLPPPTKKEFRDLGHLSDYQLFLPLGFSSLDSMDYSDYEGATVVFDLSSPDVPPHLIGSFDFILDGGTCEHVFHLPNALNHIFKMLKVGGRVLHFAPSSNHIDHGFYMFSPTLFWDYYHCNQFEINTFEFGAYSMEKHDQGFWPWRVKYSPGAIPLVGELDGMCYINICLATKTEASTGDRIPQQGSYAGHWQSAKR